MQDKVSKDPNAAGVINGTFKVGIIQITARFEKTKYLYNIIYIIIIMLYKVLFFLDSAVFKNNMYIDDISALFLSALELKNAHNITTVIYETQNNHLISQTTKKLSKILNLNLNCLAQRE